MEGQGQGQDTGNGELSRRRGSGSVQEGRRSRTPSPGAAPEGSRTPSPGAADASQSEVGLQVDEREGEFRELEVAADVPQSEVGLQGEREFRELEAQLGEIIMDRGRRHHMDEIGQRIRLVMRRWQTFIPQSPEQMHVINLRMRQLHIRFPQLEWLNDVGLPLMHHPRIRITQEHVNADNGNPLLCIICRLVFQVGQTARQLECGHTSHQSCLYASERGTCCPGCGTRLFRRVRLLPTPPRFRAQVPPPLMAGTSISISGDHISDNNSITSTCPICHVDFEFGEDANQLNCGHIHHPICISAWLPVRNNCPVCRAGPSRAEL